jgi:glutathione peroxidase
MTSSEQQTLYDFSASQIDGSEQDLSAYRGQPVLVVNTATHCGFTPQFKGLEALYQRYGGQGLAILGFPCDQFGHQNPEDEAGTASFCELNYGVTFPLFAKVDVNGADAHPLFAWLKQQKGGIGPSRIKWNFTKFLVGPDGRVVKRYGSTTAPAKIAADVERLLAL